MPVEFLEGLPTFLVEDQNLLGSVLLDDLAGDFGVGHQRGSDGESVVGRTKKNLREFDVGADLAREFFHPDGFPGFDLVLLAASADDCVRHYSNSTVFLRKTELIWVSEHPWPRQRSFKAGVPERRGAGRGTEGQAFRTQFLANLLHFGGFVHAGGRNLPDPDYGGVGRLDVSKEAEHGSAPAGVFSRAGGAFSGDLDGMDQAEVVLRVMRLFGARTAKSDRPLPRVVLYGRQDCCLCDEALEELEQARREASFDLEKIDVDTDPSLAEKYGHEVPVVEIDGRKAFKFHVSRRKFLQLLRRNS